MFKFASYIAYLTFSFSLRTYPQRLQGFRRVWRHPTTPTYIFIDVSYPCHHKLLHANQLKLLKFLIKQIFSMLFKNHCNLFQQSSAAVDNNTFYCSN
jgi:hypothetical protein